MVLVPLRYVEYGLHEDLHIIYPRGSKGRRGSRGTMILETLLHIP